MPRSIGKYEIEKNLGEGTFAKVKQARNKETNELVAIKVLNKETIQKEKMGNQVKREISIMKKICHPNVVQLYEVLASKNKIFIVLELVTGGELFDKIVKNKRLDEDTARFYFQQLCVATHYCHLQGVCHRDLKPENLLLDENGNLKISDFGLSAMFDPDDGGKSLLVTMCGTPNYVAPEVISEAKRGYEGAKADTWSIGIIEFVFLAGYLPFDEQLLPALFDKIQSADYKIPAFISPEAKDLIVRILNPDPDKRLSIPDIVKHPWWLKGGPHKDAYKTMQRLPDVSNSEFELENAVQDTVLVEPSENKMEENVIPMQKSPSQYHHVMKSAQQPTQVPIQPPQTNNLPTQPPVQSQPIASVTPSHQQPQFTSPTPLQPAQVAVPMENRTNAFEIINNCTGGPYGAIGGVADRKYQCFTKMLPTMALPAVIGTLQNIEGCIKASLNQSNSNVVNATFNLGNGVLNVQIHAKAVSSSNPPIYLLEMSRVGGDIATYHRVWTKMLPLVQFLMQV